MTANELISSYQGSDMDSEQMEVWCEEAVELLRQQAKEIEQLKLRQLTDEEIVETLDEIVGNIQHIEVLHMIIFAKAIIKASRGEE